jgi:hypothetical protein
MANHNNEMRHSARRLNAISAAREIEMGASAPVSLFILCVCCSLLMIQISRHEHTSACLRPLLFVLENAIVRGRNHHKEFGKMEFARVKNVTRIYGGASFVRKKCWNAILVLRLLQK